MKTFYYFLSGVFITVLAIGCSSKSSWLEPTSLVVDSLETLKTLKVELEEYHQRYSEGNPRAKSESNTSDFWVNIVWRGAVGAVAGAHRGPASAVVTAAVSSYVAYHHVGQSAISGLLVPNMSSSIFADDSNNSAQMVGRLHNEILLQLILEEENFKNKDLDTSVFISKAISILQSQAVFTELDLSLVRGSAASILSDISDIHRLNASITVVDEATISRSLNHFAAKYPETAKTLEINRGYLVNAFEQGDVVSVRKYTEGYDKIINSSVVSIDTKRELQSVSSTTKSTTELWRKQQ